MDKNMKITEEQVEKAMDAVYKEAGHDAYFGEGFEAGVKFALMKCAPGLSGADANIDMEPPVFENIEDAKRKLYGPDRPIVERNRQLCREIREQDQIRLQNQINELERLNELERMNDKIKSISLWKFLKIRFTNK